MSDEGEDAEKGGYEVGYGKPPKQHQFKPKSRSMDYKKSTPGSGADKAKGKVNLAPHLSDPVRARSQGKIQNMQPLEVMLRKQVEQVFRKQSLSAIKTIFDYAKKYDLVVKPPVVRGGGVLAVSMKTPEDLEFWLNYRDKSDAEFKAMLRKSR